MPSRLTIFRIAAVIILLLTGVELIACEVVCPEDCETYGSPGGQRTNSGDACLCCCSHIVVRAALVVEPVEMAVALKPVPPVSFASFEPASIYHPPKA